MRIDLDERCARRRPARRQGDLGRCPARTLCHAAREPLAVDTEHACRLVHARDGGHLCRLGPQLLRERPSPTAMPLAPARELPANPAQLNRRCRPLCHRAPRPRGYAAAITSSRTLAGRTPLIWSGTRSRRWFRMVFSPLHLASTWSPGASLIATCTTENDVGWLGSCSRLRVFATSLWKAQYRSPLSGRPSISVSGWCGPSSDIAALIRSKTTSGRVLSSSHSKDDT